MIAVRNNVLADRVRNQCGDHFGKCTDKDVDKGLEVEIAKTFYGWDNAFTPPRDRIEEYRGIDLWVNETPVQIKCNKDSKLYLEDNLFRNGEWMAGWVDVCEAYILLKTWAVGEVVYIQDYKVSELKQLIKADRDFESSRKEDPIMFKFGGPGRWCKSKDSNSSFFVHNT